VGYVHRAHEEEGVRLGFSSDKPALAYSQPRPRPCCGDGFVIDALDRVPVWPEQCRFLSDKPYECHNDFIGDKIDTVSVRSSTCTPVSTVAPSLHAPNNASSIAAISESAATTTTPATYASNDITKDNLSPGARRFYDYIMGHSDYLDGDSMAPTSTASPCVPCSAGSTDRIPAFVTGTPETDLYSVTPTTCSVECPSPDTSVHAAAPVQIATPKSSTTIGGVVPEFLVPEVADKSLDMDAMVDIASMVSICSPGGLDHSTVGEHPEAMSLNP
jgi:hypothetical protein